MSPSATSAFSSRALSRMIVNSGLLPPSAIAPILALRTEMIPPTGVLTSVRASLRSISSIWASTTFISATLATIACLAELTRAVEAVAVARNCSACETADRLALHELLGSFGLADGLRLIGLRFDELCLELRANGLGLGPVGLQLALLQGSARRAKAWRARRLP